MTDATVVRDPDPSLITTLHITYALHAIGLAIGAFGTAWVGARFNDDNIVALCTAIGC